MNTFLPPPLVQTRVPVPHLSALNLVLFYKLWDFYIICVYI
uniref:Uncharacterized protein n=1 Tax=Anguilla anguilla TaxID=7936 RepID=A0A0E9WAU0_ANGAN